MDYEGEASYSDLPAHFSAILVDCAHTLHSLSCNPLAYSVNSSCSFTNGESLLGGLLLGHSHGSFVSSGNVLRSLGNVELDVAVRGKVW